MQAWISLAGFACALKVRDGRGDLVGLWPMAPSRTQVVQNDDMSLSFKYTSPNGGVVTYQQKDVLYLFNFSLDGVTGVSPLTYARETIGESIAMAEHGRELFKNGAQVSGVLSTEKALSEGARANLREGLEQFQAGGERRGKTMVLDEGLQYQAVGLSAKDAQWLESRKFMRSEIASFFGVPPHMIGDTGNSSNWGTGLEEQGRNFVQKTLEKHLTMWEKCLKRQLLADDPDLYVHINRSALTKGDMSARWGAYQIGRQMRVLSANDVRALEDMDPIDGGDVYDNPNIDLKADEQ